MDYLLRKYRRYPSANTKEIRLKWAGEALIQRVFSNNSRSRFLGGIEGHMAWCVNTKLVLVHPNKGLIISSN